MLSWIRGAHSAVRQRVTRAGVEAQDFFDRHEFWRLVAIWMSILIVASATMVAVIRYPNLFLGHNKNNGFGSDWQCFENLRGLSNICVKKPAPQ